jgi:hypothetical protein
VEILGLGEGLEAELTPERVGVVIHGPLPVLDSLVPEDVRVTVDLFDLESGRYSIEPQVDIPDRGIQLRSVQPSAISVFITKTLTTTLDLTNTLSITGTGESLISDTLPNIGTTSIHETRLTPLGSFTRFSYDNDPEKGYKIDSNNRISERIMAFLERVQTNLSPIWGFIVISSG